MGHRSSPFVAAALALLLAGAARAFPDRPLTILVPFSPGTVTDVNAREFATVLAGIVKQPVIVDNRVGAEGLLGAQALLGAASDGHTVMFTSFSLPVLDPLMRKNQPYEFARDFAPVCTFASTTIAMAVTGAGAWKTVADVVAAAKAAPGKLTFGYSTATTRLSGEIFAQTTGIKLTAVPYRSSVNALTDVAGGQVDMIFIDPVSAMPFYQNGKLRPLTVSGHERVKTIPDVPSAVEAGVPGYRIQPWFGFYASAKTPPAVMARLRETFAQALAAPATRANLERRDLRPITLCGDEQARMQADDIGLMRQVVAKAGIQPE